MNSISKILTEDFDFKLKDAVEIEDFLLPFLEYDVKKRMDAKTGLLSEWLWS